MLPLGNSISVKISSLSRVANTSTNAFPNPIILSILDIFFAKILHISKYPITFAAHLRKNNILP